MRSLVKRFVRDTLHHVQLIVRFRGEDKQFDGFPVVQYQKKVRIKLKGIRRC
jgi:hypothetical protein